MDVAYARKVLDTIEADREHFDMGNWARRKASKEEIEAEKNQVGPINFCNTSACLAGQAVLLDPELANLMWKPRMRWDGHVQRDPSSVLTGDYVEVSGEWEADDAILQDGSMVDVADRGAQLMGLSRHIQASLFYLEDETAIKALTMLVDRVEGGMHMDEAWRIIEGELELI